VRLRSVLVSTFPEVAGALGIPSCREIPAELQVWGRIVSLRLLLSSEVVDYHSYMRYNLYK